MLPARLSDPVRRGVPATTPPQPGGRIVPPLRPAWGRARQGCGAAGAPAARSRAPFRRVASLVLTATAGLALLALSGCNLNFVEGKLRESQNRWEEAAIQYHLAVIKDPGDAEYREAYERAAHQVARENMESYKAYVANKEFAKAYNRLIDASRQDPTLADVKTEQAKWLRVLIAGQVQLDFRSLQANTSLADEIRLTVRINTPNPGEVIESEIDVDTGVFFLENLLYDRPDELLTYYTLNSIGVTLVQARNRTRQFSSKDFVRLVNFRTPSLDLPPTNLILPQGDGLVPVETQREEIHQDPWSDAPWAPPTSPPYEITVDAGCAQAKSSGANVCLMVRSESGRSDFTPRFLYVNKKDRRVFVDFGRYAVKQDETSLKWGLRRLSLATQDYFPKFSQNLALQPYFYFRDGVIAYVPVKTG